MESEPELEQQSLFGFGARAAVACQGGQFGPTRIESDQVALAEALPVHRDGDTHMGSGLVELLEKGRDLLEFVRAVTDNELLKPGFGNDRAGGREQRSNHLDGRFGEPVIELENSRLKGLPKAWCQKTQKEKKAQRSSHEPSLRAAGGTPYGIARARERFQLNPPRCSPAPEVSC